MMADEAVSQKQTLLMDAFHRAHNAKMIAFANWEVPAYYSSIIDEHNWVRRHSGIFDISHMGEVLVEGKDTIPFLQYLLTNDLTKYPAGTAYYSMICNRTGGVVDDAFVYPVHEKRAFIIINASNRAKDAEWITYQARGWAVDVTNVSDERSLYAVQGPETDAIVSRVFGIDTRTIKFHQFVEVPFNGSSVILSSSGYTGERGFEVAFDNADAEVIWNRLWDVGSQLGTLKPIGFGARDTLRLEAGCGLYGHELSETISPLEANLGWVVRLDKECDFVGKQALLEQKQNGVRRSLYGIEMVDKSVPRDGYKVFYKGLECGVVTSGSFAPTLQKQIAFVLIAAQGLTPGAEIEIEVRGKRYRAAIVKMPFYRIKK